MNDRAWILTTDRMPDVDAPVWYFFEVTGVAPGTYYGCEDGLETFGGRCGFLGGDVTHWMPRQEDDEPPGTPSGYTYPERCLLHSSRLPFDGPGYWRRSDQEQNPPKDWAHRAARGTFQVIYDLHEARMALREAPRPGSRDELVAEVADIYRQAADALAQAPNWDQASTAAVDLIDARLAAMVTVDPRDRAKAEAHNTALITVAYTQGQVVAGA